MVELVCLFDTFFNRNSGVGHDGGSLQQQFVDRQHADFFGLADVGQRLVGITFGFLEDDVGAMGIARFKSLYGTSHTVCDAATTEFRHTAGGVEEVLLFVLEFLLELVLAVQKLLQLVDHLFVLLLGIVVFLLAVLIVRVLFQLCLPALHFCQLLFLFGTQFLYFFPQFLQLCLHLLESLVGSGKGHVVEVDHGLIVYIDLLIAHLYSLFAD